MAWAIVRSEQRRVLSSGIRSTGDSDAWLVTTYKYLMLAANVSILSGKYRRGAPGRGEPVQRSEVGPYHSRSAKLLPIWIHHPSARSTIRMLTLLQVLDGYVWALIGFDTQGQRACCSGESNGGTAGWHRRAHRGTPPLELDRVAAEATTLTRDNSFNSWLRR